MSQELWTSVDNYYNTLFVEEDESLKKAEESLKNANLPPIAVSPALGKFLHLMVKISGAKRVLEIGTLAGYSTIWMAKALPETGKLVTLELSPECAKIAQENITLSGQNQKIEIMQGQAIDSLHELIDNKEEPFDLIFIDADKENNEEYFKFCLQLSKKGTVIIADNIVRKGQVIDKNTSDESTRGVQKFNKTVASEKRVNTVAIQTVGAKGYDGLGLILVEK